MDSIPPCLLVEFCTFVDSLALCHTSNLLRDIFLPHLVRKRLWRTTHVHFERIISYVERLVLSDRDNYRHHERLSNLRDLYYFVTYTLQPIPFSHLRVLNIEFHYPQKIYDFPAYIPQTVVQLIVGGGKLQLVENHSWSPHLTQLEISEVGHMTGVWPPQLTDLQLGHTVSWLINIQPFPATLQKLTCNGCSGNILSHVPPTVTNLTLYMCDCPDFHLGHLIHVTDLDVEFPPSFKDIQSCSFPPNLTCLIIRGYIEILPISLLPRSLEDVFVERCKNKDEIYNWVWKQQIIKMLDQTS